MHAEDVDLEPEILMHDRNAKFTKEFDEIIKSSSSKIKKTPIRSPNLQVHVERVVQTLKHEVLNEFVVVSEKHLNHICREAQIWYNNERGHSARENLPPNWEQPSEEVQTIKLEDVACSTRLGGRLNFIHSEVKQFHPLRVIRAEFYFPKVFKVFLYTASYYSYQGG